MKENLVYTLTVVPAQLGADRAGRAVSDGHIEHLGVPLADLGGHPVEESGPELVMLYEMNICIKVYRVGRAIFSSHQNSMQPRYLLESFHSTVGNMPGYG